MLEAAMPEVYSTAFSPDGSLLATGTADQVLKLWNTATGKERATLKGHTGPIHFLAFAEAGKLVASQLYGVAPNDPVTITLAGLLLFAIALIASFLPARRAALLDPLAALREE